MHLRARVAPTPFALRALRGARQTDCSVGLFAWCRSMFHGRRAGGPKQSKWKDSARALFVGFFGKRSGSLLGDGPSEKPDEQCPAAAPVEFELPLLPLPVQLPLESVPDPSGSGTILRRVEARSPVPAAGDEDLILTGTGGHLYMYISEKQRTERARRHGKA